MAEDLRHELVSALKKLASERGKIPTRLEFYQVITNGEKKVAKTFGSYSVLLQACGLPTYDQRRSKTGADGPVMKIADSLIEDFPELRKPPRKLYIDIETAPINARVWGLYDQNIGTNQIIGDWFIMSFAAKLDGVVHYLDQRYASDISDDRMLLEAVHHLLDQADIVYTWNGDKFDIKKLNARFLKHKMPKPLSFRSVDGLKIARRNFAITSNKLDYVAKFLGVTAKLAVRKFVGQELWNECLAGNMEAWEEMERYNKQDIVALEEVIEVLEAWDKKINYSMFEHKQKCSCGSDKFESAGVIVTNAGKFERFVCVSCRKEYQSKVNLIHPDTRKSILR